MLVHFCMIRQKQEICLSLLVEYYNLFGCIFLAK